VFENWALSGISGPRRDEVTGGWRKLHNEELYNLYSLPSIIRMMKSKRMKSEEYVIQRREMRNAYKHLVNKPERNRLLGRPRYRCLDNTARSSGQN
jgi:hypothetical protein